MGTQSVRFPVTSPDRVSMHTRGHIHADFNRLVSGMSGIERKGYPSPVSPQISHWSLEYEIRLLKVGLD